MYSNNNHHEPPDNASQAFITLGEFLQQDDWHPQKVDDKLIYRCNYNGRNGAYTCYAIIRPDLEQFLFYAQTSVKVPENARYRVAEYLTRANYGLRIGNFEMDFADGEVRYKTSLDFEGSELTSPWIRNMLYPAVQTMDRYFPGLMRVIYSDHEPEEIIKEIEESS